MLYLVTWVPILDPHVINSVTVDEPSHCLSLGWQPFQTRSELILTRQECVSMLITPRPRRGLAQMRYAKSNQGDCYLSYHRWQTRCSFPFHEIQDKACCREGIGTRVPHRLVLVPQESLKDHYVGKCH